MYWTLDLASKLEDAPWPATKDELMKDLINDNISCLDYIDRENIVQQDNVFLIKMK